MALLEQLLPAATQRSLLLFVALQAGDALTTVVGLRLGAVEKNALAASWFAFAGPLLGEVSLKLLALGVIALVLRRIGLQWPQASLHWQVLALGNVCYCLVVLNNLWVIAG